MKLLSTVLLASTLSSSSAYFSSNTRRATSTSTFVRVNNDEKKSKLSTLMRMSKDDERDAGIGSGLLSKFNPLKEIGDMFQNLDDVIDDFYNKRMGQGEIFYGKRKYKPSGNVESAYNGMGLTDKQRIDDAREYKAQFEEERQIRKEMAELRRAKEERDRARYQ